MYIDGTPISEFIKMAQDYESEIRKMALETEFDKDILLRMDIIKNGETTTGYAWTTSFKKGIQKRRFDVSFKDSIPAFLRNNQIVVFSETIEGMLSDGETNLCIKREIGSTEHFFRMAGYFLGYPDLYKAIEETPINYVHQYRARMGIKSTDSYEIEMEEMKKSDFELVYNERNWRTDFCLVDNRDESVLEFNSIDEIREFLKTISPDSSLTFDDYTFVHGSFVDIKKMIYKFFQKGACPDEFGYDHAGEILKEIADIVCEK